ncbi:MAG: glycosyltransferase family 2 protein [Candidatus Buchananbacteria bacterium]
MDISIILLNYKSKELIKQCLKGVVLSQPQLDYEIIVVDNDSDDGCLEMVNNLFSREYIQRFRLANGKELVVPPIVTMQSKVNGGFAYGNNLGIKAAKGKYVMILNSDIAIVSGVIEKMYHYLEHNESVGMIGPKLIYPDGTIQYSCRRFPNTFVPLYRRTIFGKLPFAQNSVNQYLMIDIEHDKTIPVDWLFGACLLIRQSILVKVGLFDERFFMYFEDLDLCRRFWENKSQVVYFPEVVLVHYHTRFSAEREGILGVFKLGGRIHLISGIKYFLKYFGIKTPGRS